MLHGLELPLYYVSLMLLSALFCAFVVPFSYSDRQYLDVSARINQSQQNLQANWIYLDILFIRWKPYCTAIRVSSRKIPESWIAQREYIWIPTETAGALVPICYPRRFQEEHREPIREVNPASWLSTASPLIHFLCSFVLPLAYFTLLIKFYLYFL